MNIILFGAPGAGKGTQAALIAKRFSWQHVSTGDMLRRAVALGSQLGKEVASIMNKGGLIDDDLMFDLLEDRLAQPDCQKGFILDGFPRNLVQAKRVMKMSFTINCVLYLEVDQGEVIERLSNRRIHLASGRVYHTIHNPPKVPNIDDITQEVLIHRKDDFPEQIQARFQLFNDKTMPILNFLLDKVDIKTIRSSGLSVNEVYDAIQKQLK
jgi:adenylate kinase